MVTNERSARSLLLHGTAYMITMRTTSDDGIDVRSFYHVQHIHKEYTRLLEQYLVIQFSRNDHISSLMNTTPSRFPEVDRM